MLFSHQTNSISLQNIQRLAKCRGWAMTLAIFLFLYSALLFLGVVGNLIHYSGGILPIIINLFTAGFCIAAGINFCKFFGYIHKAAVTLNAGNLEYAMKSQAKAWLYIGICTILYFIVNIILLAIIILA